MSEPTEPQLIHPLVAEIVSANVANLAAMTDSVIADITYRAERAEAKLDLIRSAILRLTDGDWAPSTHALERALYPDDGLVEACIASRVAN